MKFSCTQENLFHCLASVSRVAARAGNLPILSHIYLKAGEEGIFLKATNLEVGVTCQLRGKVEKEGEFTVPAKLFTDYIASLPKDRIDILLEEQALKISSGRHRTALKGTPAADFPLIPPVEEGAVRIVAVPDLIEGLEQVLFTISPAETRPEISGAAFMFSKDKLTVAGTDSYRLAEKTLTPQGGGKEELKIIVPARACQELLKICLQTGEETDTAKMTASANQFAVTFPTAEFVSRLIEGQYPDYKAIIPANFGTRATVSRTEFSGALKAAGLFSRAGVYDVAVEIDPQGTLTVTALNSQTGEHVSTLDAEAKGQRAKIAFNWKYLLDGVNALRADKIVLNTTDSSSPTKLQEEKGSDYFYIVMPIKE